MSIFRHTGSTGWMYVWNRARHQRIVSLHLSLLVLAAAAPVPAAAAAPADGMKWGMNVPAIDALAEAGATPDYAMTWVGVWNDGNWDPVKSALRKTKAAGVTPVIQWYFWGDDVSAECVENGCWSNLHGGYKSKAKWFRMAETLRDVITEEMGGAPVVVIVDTEFNKNGIDHHTYAPTFDAYLKRQHDVLHEAPNVEIVVGFGGWGDSRWTRFPNAVESAEYVGYQALRSSVRQSLDKYLGTPQDLIDLAGLMNARFPGKAVFITDMAYSSYPEPEWASHQESVLSEFFSRMDDLKARNVKAFMYRSLFDVDMDTANYHGEAERWWGLRHQDATAKPSYQVWLDGVGATPPPPPPPKEVPARLEAEAMDASAGGRQSDSRASGGAAWNLWANGEVREWIAAPSSGTYEATIRARGSVANGGWPDMRVFLGETQVARFDVASTSYGDYRVRVDLVGGEAAKLRVAFVNDHRTSTEDRNLVVDYAEVTLVKLANSAPSASFTATVSDRTVTVDARASSDADGDALTYAWTFGDSASASGPTSSHTYAASGTYTVELTVSDGQEATTATRTVTANAPPVAAFQWNASGLTATVDASASSDADDDALSYAWRFGDGTEGAGVRASRTYAAADVYDVTLTVTDAQGASSSSTRAVSVKDFPVAEFSWSADHLSISVDGSSSRDPQGGPLAHRWAFGDGSSVSGVTATHAYASEGTYDVTLTVTDTGGNTGRSTKPVTVVRPNAAPEPTFEWTADELSVRFDASSTRDPDGDPVTFAWRFGDGTTASGPTPTKAYAKGGTYVVALTTTDDRGASATVTRNVTVNRPPVAESSVTTSGLSAFGSAGASSDPDGDGLTFAWDWGDGSKSTGMESSRTYAASGTYAVTLTVSDGKATSTATRTVIVEAPRPAYFPASLEAEDFAKKGTGGGYSDGAASGSRGWNVWSNGEISNPLVVEKGGAYVLKVRARGDPALGVYPIMEVRLDGKVVDRFGVKADYADYAVRILLEANATRTLSVAFVNDHYDKAKGEDRNLLVDVATLGPAPGVVGIEAEAFAYKGSGARYSAGDASGGAWWNLWSNGYAQDSVTVDATGTYLFAVRARGDPAAGEWPRMVVEVGGVKVAEHTVSSSTWQPYDQTVHLAAGEHEVRIHFVNDHYDKATKTDRNLHLDVLRVRLA